MSKQTYKMDGNKIVDTTSVSHNPVENISALEQAARDNYKKCNTETLAAFNSRQVKQGAICTSEDGVPWLPYKMASEKPYFIVSQGYYLCMHNGSVYFIKDDDDNDTDGKLPLVLRKPLNNCGGSGKGVIKLSFIPDTKNPNARKIGDNLSQADMDSIIKGKPSIDDLLAVYDCWSNDEININAATAIPVW